jgi:hypothetical protein
MRLGGQKVTNTPLNRGVAFLYPLAFRHPPILFQQNTCCVTTKCALCDSKMCVVWQQIQFLPNTHPKKPQKLAVRPVLRPKQLFYRA